MSGKNAIFTVTEMTFGKAVDPLAASYFKNARSISISRPNDYDRLSPIFVSKVCNGTVHTV
jgi:hypothetical protein